MEFREDLPKSIVGKVLRRVIREEEDRRHCDGTEYVDDIEPGGDDDGFPPSSKRAKRDKRGKKSKKDGRNDS